MTGGSATVVLGQTGFGANAENQGGSPAASTLAYPYAPRFDSAGNMWVSDSLNHHVLMYPQVSLATNDPAATVELGQPAGASAFTSNTSNNPTPGAGTLYLPKGLALDSSGRLFVLDAGNDRTLVFAPPFSNGMAATLVIGQPNFTTNISGSGAANLGYGAAGVATY